MRRYRLIKRSREGVELWDTSNMYLVCWKSAGLYHFFMSKKAAEIDFRKESLGTHHTS